MTNTPQIENGYLKIATELLTAFCSFRIPGEVRQIIDCIIRRTYGYHKKEDWISESQFVQLTGMKRQNVWRALDKAIKHKIAIKSDCKLRLNKNYNEWISFDLQSKVIARKMQSKVITPAIKSDAKMQSKVMDTKDNKDNIQKIMCTTSLKFCDDYCIWNIGMELGVHKNYVKEESESLKIYIEDHPRKYKIFHRTLVNWVKMSLKKGYIQPMTEMERLDMPLEHPDYLKKWQETHDVLVRKGIL